MSTALARARSSWLLAFGDVVTLLLTFLIVVVVINKSDINPQQSWVDEQLNQSYLSLHNQLEQNGFQYIQISREPRGILLVIRGQDAFESGAYEPSKILFSELRQIGRLLPDVKVLNIESSEEGRKALDKAKINGQKWLAEVSILGHTDNDWVDPESRLRNNFLLSTLRAEAVMSVLQQQSGMAANRFSITGYGEWQPVALNTNETGKRQNRRVEILITAGFI